MEQTLNLTVKKSDFITFFPLFQQGVIIKTLAGGLSKICFPIHLEMTPRICGKQDPNCLPERESRG